MAPASESAAGVELQRAWDWRERQGLLRGDALRIFHGPGESAGALRGLAIDRYGENYWVTLWEGQSLEEGALEAVRGFLESRGARSAVYLPRPERGIPGEPVTLLGEPPAGRFEVSEDRLRFLIQFREVRHPGLFLDHAPLRSWLAEEARGRRVLNTFSYTGSLSVAAACGGAGHVTTLDLSRPTIAWAEENWKANGLAAARGDFIYGDYFDWLPRLRRQGRSFDCVILDPPSFSRGKKGSFSTDRDLEKLHRVAFEVLEPGGLLITSINSAKVSRDQYESEIGAAARGRALEVVREISLPATFPTRAAADHYLKGWILRVG